MITPVDSTSEVPFASNWRGREPTMHRAESKTKGPENREEFAAYFSPRHICLTNNTLWSRDSAGRSRKARDDGEGAATRRLS